MEGLVQVGRAARDKIKSLTEKIKEISAQNQEQRDANQTLQRRLDEMEKAGQSPRHAATAVRVAMRRL